VKCENTVKNQDPELYGYVQQEFERQTLGLEMIASENYASAAVMEAQGSIFTNKYAEGYPGKRYYGGCEFIDKVEALAIERAKKLFGAEHANVQPHSGSGANMAVFMACLKPGDKVLGMDLNQGGHLTHGSPVNFSGKLYDFEVYGVDKETHLINYDLLEEQALKVKPKLIIAGYSAYPRSLDFKRFREIADKVDAYLHVDMAHFAGLVAAGIHESPVPYADFVTSTTHKTLRGPRGGIILCRDEMKKKLNSQIFPGIQGGPLEHVILAKAVAFGEALKPEFLDYQKQVVNNAKALAKSLVDHGYGLVSGGTDNHLVLVDLSSKGITGKLAEESLDKAAITVNKNTVPDEKLSPFVTSGVRLGTPALTTRGMKESEMSVIGDLIHKVLSNPEDASVLEDVKNKVVSLCKDFPIYAS